MKSGLNPSLVLSVRKMLAWLLPVSLTQIMRWWKGGKKEMRKVIISYGRKTAGKVLERGQMVNEKLTGNANFPDLPVTLVDLDAQNTALQDAITASVDKGQAALALVRAEKKTLAGMLRQLAEYVNTTVTDGDEVKLLSSGFELTKIPVSSHPAGAISKIKAVYTNISGTIDLAWTRAILARYYRVFMSADNGVTWTLLDTVFGRKLLVNGLASGKRYQFKVVAVAVGGDGPESEIATQVAA